MSKQRANPQATELRQLMVQLFRRFGVLAADATPCGKPLSMAHAHALMVLHAQGELSQQDLGRELCIDKSNVARLCARMADGGHLEQRVSPHDGRSRRVCLTNGGTRLAREVEAASLARFGALLGALKPSARGQIVASMQQLVAALETLPANPPNARIPE
jgi:DNA-binding MarR family transcriptional regulator